MCKFKTQVGCPSNAKVFEGNSKPWIRKREQVLPNKIIIAAHSRVKKFWRIIESSRNQLVREKRNSENTVDVIWSERKMAPNECRLLASRWRRNGTLKNTLHELVRTLSALDLNVQVTDIHTTNKPTNILTAKEKSREWVNYTAPIDVTEKTQVETIGDNTESKVTIQVSVIQWLQQNWL